MITSSTIVKVAIYQKQLEIFDVVKKKLKRELLENSVIIHSTYEGLDLCGLNPPVSLFKIYRENECIWVRDETRYKIANEDVHSRSLVSVEQSTDIDRAVLDIVDTVLVYFDEAKKRSKSIWQVREMEILAQSPEDYNLEE